MFSNLILIITIDANRIGSKPQRGRFSCWIKDVVLRHKYNFLTNIYHWKRSQQAEFSAITQQPNYLYFSNIPWEFSGPSCSILQIVFLSIVGSFSCKPVKFAIKVFNVSTFKIIKNRISANEHCVFEIIFRARLGTGTKKPQHRNQSKTKRKQKKKTRKLVN